MLVGNCTKALATSRVGFSWNIFFFIFIFALATIQLNQPLGLDELGTYLTICKGVSRSIQLAIENPQQSPPYYFILGLWTKAFGTSEIALRMPSLIFALATLYISYLIFEKLYGKRISSSAILVLGLNFNYFFDVALAARPYSLALLMAVLSLFYLTKWKPPGLLNSNFILAVSFSILSVYAHLTAILSVSIPILYLLFYHKTNFVKATICFSLAVIALAVFPIVFPGTVFHDSKVYTLIPQSHLLDFGIYYSYFSDLIENLRFVFLSLLLAALPSIYWRIERVGQLNIKIKYEFIIAWLLAPIIIFYIFELMTGTFLMATRYTYWSLAAKSLIISCLLVSFSRSEKHLSRSKLIYILLSCFVLAVGVYVKSDTTSWRSIASTINELKKGRKNSAVFLAAPFVEGRSVEYLKKYEGVGNFNAPFNYYRINLPTYILPNERQSSENIEFEDRLLTNHLGRVNHLILISSWNGVYPIKQVAEKMSNFGYQVIGKLILDNFEIIELEKIQETIAN